MSEFYRNYLAVAVFIGAALLMVGAMLGVGRLLRPKHPDAAKLMAAARADTDPRRRLVVEMLSRTGMRAGELCDLAADAGYRSSTSVPH